MRLSPLSAHIGGRLISRTAFVLLEDGAVSLGVVAWPAPLVARVLNRARRKL